MKEFGKEMKIDIKQKERKSSRDKCLLNLLKSPASLASGISTIFLPENSNELCDKLKLLQQEKQASNIFNLFNEEFVAIVDKLLEYKCISTKQHKHILFKGNLLHIKKKLV